MQGPRKRVNTCRDRDGTSDFNNSANPQWMSGGPSGEKPFYQRMLDAYAEKQEGKG